MRLLMRRRTRLKKTEKIKVLLCYQLLKLTQQSAFIVFRFVNRLYLKLRFVSNTFFTKSSHCGIIIRKIFDTYQQVLYHQKLFLVSECTSKLSAGDSSLEIINCVCHSSGLSKFLGNIHKKYFLKLHYITYQTIKVRRMHLCMYLCTY